MSSESTPMRILTESQVKACLTVSLALQASAHAFYTAAHHTSITPTRLVLTLPPLSPTAAASHTLFKPSLTPSSLGVKVVSVRPFNASLDPPLPTVPASILLISPLTGLPLCLLSATHLTAARTAAGSALSAQLFASPTASSLAVFGAGLQAEAHVHALLAVRPSLTTVHVINRSAARAHALLDRLRAVYPAVAFQATVIGEVKEGEVGWEVLRGVVVGCQVVCVCTNAARPLLWSAMVADGAHVCAVGSYTAECREVDSALIRRCRLVVDDDNAWGSGDLAQPFKEGVIGKEHAQGVLGDYVSEQFAEWPVLPHAHPANEGGHEQPHATATPAKQLRTSERYVAAHTAMALHARVEQATGTDLHGSLYAVCSDVTFFKR